MEIRNLITDDRAVSPVIGVILMVAITVILAAVIGTFVLGLGDSVQQTTPNANFAGDQSTATYNESQFNTLSITHEGGDRIDQSNLAVTVNGQQGWGDDGEGNATALWDNADGSVTAGSSVTVVAFGDEMAGNEDYSTLAIEDNTFDDYPNAIASGDNIRVIWSSDDGSSSATLFNRQVN